MQAVILCGGLGSEFEETENKPKPMVEIGSRLFYGIL